MHKGSWDEFGGWPEDEQEMFSVGALIWEALCGMFILAVCVVWWVIL